MAKSSPTSPSITVSHDGVSTNYTTVADAFAAAQDNDSITFGPGTYDIGSLQITDNSLIIKGVTGTVLNGGLQVDAAVTELSVQNLTIINGAPQPDWGYTPIGIYSYGDTHLAVDNVRFQDTSGAVDMVGISARTAAPDAGAEFDISGSTFWNLANGVDVENGVSADIDGSLFHNAAIVTNNTDGTQHLTVTNTQFASTGLVFNAGNQWGELVLEGNRGNDDYYIYSGSEAPIVLPGDDYQGTGVVVGSAGFSLPPSGDLLF